MDRLALLFEVRIVQGFHRFREPVRGRIYDCERRAEFMADDSDEVCLERGEFPLFPE